MRTTLNIDEEALAILRNRADAKGLSLGAAATELIKETAKPHDYEIAEGPSGFPCFKLPSGAAKVTSEQVREAWESEALDQDATLRR
ncbi:MAG: hypothetical protein ACQKBV_11735 [Puniceicoccales bacterium]